MNKPLDDPNPNLNNRIITTLILATLETTLTLTLPTIGNWNPNPNPSKKGTDILSPINPRLF